MTHVVLMAPSKRMSTFAVRKEVDPGVSLSPMYSGETMFSVRCEHNYVNAKGSILSTSYLSLSSSSTHRFQGHALGVRRRLHVVCFWDKTGSNGTLLRIVSIMINNYLTHDSVRHHQRIDRL